MTASVVAKGRHPARVLVLPQYSALGASSRIRVLQYLPELERSGFTFDVDPLFDDWYLEELYATRITKWHRVALAYLSRLSSILRGRHYDAVWLQKELLPWLPTWLDRACLRDTSLIVDYDDAVFHRYDQHSNAWVRRALADKVGRVMRMAAIVTVGNDYLADHARNAGARRVEQIPSAVDIDRYRTRSPTRGSAFTVGWIGTPQTARFLRTISTALARLAARGVRFVFVGCPKTLDLGVPFEAPAWSEATEAAEIANFDCGIMPLIDAPFERGKCGYKLIQYMACAVPVVASPVGFNNVLVAHGERGFLASSTEEWVERVMQLVDDPALAASMGCRGREVVERQYSTQVVTPRLATLLDEACRVRHTG